MKLVAYIKSLFHKEKIPSVFCECGQMVDEALHEESVKGHRIGHYQNKKGKLLMLYCNGAEV